MRKKTSLLCCLLLACTAGIAQVNRHSPAKSRLESYLDKKSWNALFPHRNNFYSYEALVTAARAFPLFLGEGDDQARRRELAAFLANIAQETSGGWAAAPGGYFKWGLYFIEEQAAGGSPGRYADSTKKNYPPVAGKSYYGRGPKQLSWNYNYGQFSEAWFGNKDTLLLHPERLARDPVLSFASAIWFWTTAQPPKPSCHDIMIGKWQPAAADIQKGRLPGFGVTVNVINGGVECGSGKNQEKTKYRYAYYNYFCSVLRVSPGQNTGCENQTPFGQ